MKNMFVESNWVGLTFWIDFFCSDPKVSRNRMSTVGCCLIFSPPCQRHLIFYKSSSNPLWDGISRSLMWHSGFMECDDLEEHCAYSVIFIDTNVQNHVEKNLWMLNWLFLFQSKSVILGKNILALHMWQVVEYNDLSTLGEKSEQ